MLVALIIVLMIILTWAFLVYVRKSLWDTVHRNLLDLEDLYEGKVIRKSILARPVFHGKFNGTNLTLNFSSEKGLNGRVNYIDVSYDLNTNCSITLTSKEWLDEQTDQEQEDYQILKNSSGHTFLIRPASKDEVQELIKKDAFRDFTETFMDLGYFFSGKTGVLCEYVSENIADSTKIENLEKRLKLIVELARAIH